MRFALLHATLLGLMAGCSGHSNIKPTDVLDERTGMTVGALQSPVEFVENAQSAMLANSQRASFAYVGPVEWDRMGEITYALWVHVAPGNDRPVGDLRAPGAVTVQLDDGPMVLAANDTPADGNGPYKRVASWGQSVYFDLDPEKLKRLAASRTMKLEFRSRDDAGVDFLPTRETHDTFTEFARTRGIIGD